MWGESPQLPLGPGDGGSPSLPVRHRSSGETFLIVLTVVFGIPLVMILWAMLMVLLGESLSPRSQRTATTTVRGWESNLLSWLRVLFSLAFHQNSWAALVSATATATLVASVARAVGRRDAMLVSAATVVSAVRTVVSAAVERASTEVAPRSMSGTLAYGLNSTIHSV